MLPPVPEGCSDGHIEGHSGRVAVEGGSGARDTRNPDPSVSGGGRATLWLLFRGGVQSLRALLAWAVKIIAHGLRWMLWTAPRRALGLVIQLACRLLTLRLEVSTNRLPGPSYWPGMVLSAKSRLHVLFGALRIEGLVKLHLGDFSSSGQDGTRIPIAPITQEPTAAHKTAIASDELRVVCSPSARQDIIQFLKSRADANAMVVQFCRSTCQEDAGPSMRCSTTATGIVGSAPLRHKLGDESSSSPCYQRRSSPGPTGGGDEPHTPPARPHPLLSETAADGHAAAPVPTPWLGPPSPLSGSPPQLSSRPPAPAQHAPTTPSSTASCSPLRSTPPGLIASPLGGHEQGPVPVLRAPALDTGLASPQRPSSTPALMLSPVAARVLGLTDHGSTLGREASTSATPGANLAATPCASPWAVSSGSQANSQSGSNIGASGGWSGSTGQPLLLSETRQSFRSSALSSPRVELTGLQFGRRSPDSAVVASAQGLQALLNDHDLVGRG